MVALRCEKPERIRELLHRGYDALQQIPAVKAQQIQFADCKDLDGFEEITASMLNLVGKRPVIDAAPVKARPAAVWETGKPPHAATYVDTDGTCCRRYGLPNATIMVRGCR